MGWDEQRVSFGAIAETYDSHRPDWPAPTAAWLTGTERGGPLAARAAAGGLDVLDLGAGTGKLTRTLVEAGHRVTAVDVSDGMLAVLERALPQATVLVGSGEQIPVADHSIDVITVAQAWHWMSQPETALECARVLRPGGLLAVAWHRRLIDEERMAELDRLTEAPGRSSSRSVRSEAAVTGLGLPGEFGDPQGATFDYEQCVTPANLAALASSWSYVAVHPDRDQILADVEALGRRTADPDGTITLPHITQCYRAVRTAL
jgi:SAM-dependent methyltransferase